MDIECKNVFLKIGIIFDAEEEINGKLIIRELLLDNEKYKTLKTNIDELKKTLSSSSLTSMQKTAEQNQKWPLLNLVRQILSSYKYTMKPIRKSDGYTPEGIKKYKRYFLINKKIEH
jgi:hypothetical protein